MADDRIYDAINLFKYSSIGQGTADIGGDAEYRARYLRLSQDVIAKLWRLWSEDEIGFHTFTDSTIGDSQTGRDGPDIRVSRRIEPSTDPTRYATEAEQGKLAASSCNLVHEATHLVRQYTSYPEEEVLCRTIQQFYFRELRDGRSYTSRVTGTRLTARFGSNVPFFSDYSGRDVRLSSRDLIDNVFNITEYRRDLESRETASFVVRSLTWWGGLGNRWPSTRGYYLRSLASQTQDFAEPILQILESLDRARWPAARSCAGDLERVRRGLRLTRHGGGAVRIGATLSYSGAFPDRVRRVQDRLGESFGV